MTNLKSIHFLLTYACNYKCDHCFLYCGPDSEGVFTIEQVETILEEATRIGTIEFIYFEGGEPFLYYPIMLEGMKRAKNKGFDLGLVTNSYWATNIKDAEIWLEPLSKIGIRSMEISDDLFHFDNKTDNLAKNARIAAEHLGIPVSSISIETPTIKEGIEKTHDKGAPVIGGGAMFRGRAVETLIEGLPRRVWGEFTSCPYEDLIKLGRIHIDPFGNAQICQGLSIGNAWKTPLSEIIAKYNVDDHPICSPLTKGGPVELARTYNLKHQKRYVDECHFCYDLRVMLLEEFPEYLCPNQVYGLGND